MTASTTLRRGAPYALFGAAVFLLGHVAVTFAPTGSEVAAWWPAAGVGVAVIARQHHARRSFVSTLVLVSALANLTAGRPMLVAIGFGLSNGLEAWIAAGWMNRRSTHRPSLANFADVGRFVTGVLLGSTAAACGAALTVAAFTNGDALGVLIAVVPSHATAVFLIAPFALSVAHATPRRSVEYVLAWSSVVATTVVVFSTAGNQRLAFLVIPVLLWSAARLGLRAVTGQLVVVGLVATFFISQVPGGMAADGPASWFTLIQLYLITCSILLVTFAVALADRERAVQRAQANEATYRAGFAETVVGMVLTRVEDRAMHVIEVNGAAVSLFGLKIGERFGGVLETEDGRTIVDIAASLEPGSGVREEMRRTKGDRARWFDVSATRLGTPEDQRVVSLQIVETTRRHQVEAEMERAVRTDRLTGLPNRTGLAQRVSTELEIAVANGEPLALIAVDIDGFGSINEVFGHAAGDAVLTEIANRLSSIVRVGDTVARLGADEFLMLCPGAGTPAAAVVLAERAWAATDLPLDIGGLQYEVSLSVGVAISEPDSNTESMLSEADLAVSAAKAGGKGRVTLYSDELREVAAYRLRTVAETRRAINNDEFEMFMQPVIDLGTGRTIAAEALIRWRLPDGSLRSPAEWLDVAEQSGMMTEIGQWVLDDSVRQAAQWVAALGEADAPAVHVNVSARQFERRGFADVVIDTLRRHGLPPRFLIIELTETVLARADGALFAEFEVLANYGVRLAADDFGTGYSPLTRIVELPIHMVKIDRSFIANIATDQRCHAIVSAVVEMAHRLGLETVAEGIENEEQRRLVTEMGCETAQGFLWSPAVEERVFLSQLTGTHASALNG